MPQFSVLMANYNGAPYIDESINSVLAQTFTDWELLIVDDASKDDSVRRIEKYLGDPRIQLYSREENEGTTRAQIYGLTKISSDVVGILDSDDALLPQAIEKVLTVYRERPELGLVLTQMIVCDSDLQPLLTTTNTPMHLCEPLLWMRGSTHFRTFKVATYNKTAGLDANLRVAEDWDLLFKLEEVAPTYRLDDPLYLHRKRTASLSNAPQAHNKGSRALAIYKAFLRRRGTTVPNIPYPALLAWLVAAARDLLDLGKHTQAAIFALRALRIAPFEGASWRVLFKSATAWKESTRIASVPNRMGLTRLRYYPVNSVKTKTGNIEPDRVMCTPLVHTSGHCLFGVDYIVTQDGRYRATFEMSVHAYAFSQDPLVILDVYENLKEKIVLAERQITLAELVEQSDSFSLDFSARVQHRVELRVFWRGQCNLMVRGVALDKLDHI